MHYNGVYSSIYIIYSIQNSQRGKDASSRRATPVQNKIEKVNRKMIEGLIMSIETVKFHLNLERSFYLL